MLVEEEKEDVENTLKMVPADIILEPGKYEMKKRQQRLRLHSESMALLEQVRINIYKEAEVLWKSSFNSINSILNKLNDLCRLKI